jgi:hypothetical protein
MRSVRQHVLRWWGSGTVPDRAAPLSREQLLALCYLMVGVNSLAFYFVPQPGYDHHANLALAALLFISEISDFESFVCILITFLSCIFRCI